MRKLISLVAGLFVLTGCLKIKEQSTEVTLNLDGTGHMKILYTDISSDETNAASAAAEIEEMFADYRRGKYHEMHREMGLQDVSVALERDSTKRLNGTVEGGFSNIWTLVRALGVERLTTDDVFQVSFGGGKMAFRLHDHSWSTVHDDLNSTVSVHLLQGEIVKSNADSLTSDRKTAKWSMGAMATNGIAFDASLPPSAPAKK